MIEKREDGFWRTVGEILGIIKERSSNDPYQQPRNNRACYHAKRRGDCWYYQTGRCSCKEEAK